MSNRFEQFEKMLEKLNLSITSQMEEQFLIYYDLLIQWGKVMNLTAITDFDEVVVKHFLDSVVLGAYYDLKGPFTMMDVGTGAGFPGIPLKIMYPHLSIVLADSLKKRVRFLDEAIEKLGLEQITAVHGRAEDLARASEYREQFDLCVSRAVANLASLSEYCLPFVKVGGTFIPYKSGEIDKEASDSKKAIYLLGGRLKNIQKFQLPNTEYQRSLLFIDKVDHTSKKFPRKAGVPGRQPLE